MEGIEYFPELIGFGDVKLESKYGIFSVGLTQNKKVITGYQWYYKYWNGETVRLIHSYDLRILRRKVLDLGLDWIITDNRKAIETYKLNNEFMKKHDDYLKNNKKGKRYYGQTGVKYVSKLKDKDYRKGYTWVYKSPVSKSISCCSLLGLKSKVESKGYSWDVKDKVLYDESLEQDKIMDLE